jgi:hypothetical protein
MKIEEREGNDKSRHHSPLCQTLSPQYFKMELMVATLRQMLDFGL